MKYGARQAGLNMIAAAIILLLGIFFLVFGLSEIKNPRFDWYVWGGWATTVMSGIIFGVLFISTGAYGVYFFAKHLRAKHKKAKTKAGSSGGTQVGQRSADSIRC